MTEEAVKITNKRTKCPPDPQNLSVVAYDIIVTSRPADGDKQQQLRRLTPSSRE